MLHRPIHAPCFRLVYKEPIAPKTETSPPPAHNSGKSISTTSSRPASLDARTRKCVSCGEQKSYDNFPKHATNVDGVASFCRQCKNALAVERRLKDPIARITHYTVTRIKNEWPASALPKDLQTNLEGYLGYKLSTLVSHLRKELKEREGITLLAAFKAKYHLDHIKPHKLFKMGQIGDQSFQECWAITNLMLIPAKDNLKKGSKHTNIVDMDEVDD